MEFSVPDMIRGIKKEFFAYRNGIVADALRKGGSKSEIIFGLQIPQIAEIAKNLPHSVELADTLWNDSKVRESRLLAAYLYPPEGMSEKKALELVAEVSDREQADILSFRLLKKLPCAEELYEIISKDREKYINFPPDSLGRHLMKNA